MKRRSGKRGGARVTLRDVATAADVSVMTVSNFVNGKRSAMSTETRSRVAEEIRRLNYRPNTAARNLRMSKRFSIGMIIVDDEPNFLSDPFTTQILAGLTNTLSRAGYGMQVQGVGVDEFTTSPIVNDIRTDGICILLSGPPMVRRGVISTLLTVGQPLIVLQESFHIPNADACLIRQADRDGGRLVAQSALRAGARKLIALVPACEWAAIEERVAGMKEVLDADGTGVTLRILRCGRADFADTQAALENDISENGLPSGILAGNDQMGIAALKLVLQKGVRVPQDLVVSGFNAFEFWRYSTPLLTSVKSQAELIGISAGVSMLNRLAKGKFEKSEIIFPVTLVSGETC
jgi:LacI family transcriptional regulator